MNPNETHSPKKLTGTYQIVKVVNYLKNKKCGKAIIKARIRKNKRNEGYIYLHKHNSN